MIWWGVLAGLTEVVAASSVTLGVVATVWGAARIARNGRVQPADVQRLEVHGRVMERQLGSVHRKLDAFDGKIDGVQDAVSELGGTIKMLPCVRDGRCDRT